MKAEDKRKQILTWYQEGKIKSVGDNCFSVPSEAFVMGITPSLVTKTLKGKTFDIDKELDKISVPCGDISNLEVPKCPACGKELRIGFTERGTMIWNDGHWEETDKGNDADYYCLECGHNFDYEELEKLGVF